MAVERSPVALPEAVQGGSRREALTALRDFLAETIVGADDKTVAPLAAQLANVLRELDDLPVAEEKSVVNDLATRRAARRSKAAGL